MGVVYRARGPSGELVAIKVLGVQQDTEALDRFKREERLHEGLGRTEGFVPRIASGVSSEGPYIVMPLVTGGTLRDRLARGPLSIEEARRIGHAIARALGHAHALGVIHRDLKPENILFM